MAQYQAFSVTQGSDSFGAKYQASVVVAVLWFCIGIDSNTTCSYVYDAQSNPGLRIRRFFC